MRALVEILVSHLLPSAERLFFFSFLLDHVRIQGSMIVVRAGRRFFSGAFPPLLAHEKTVKGIKNKETGLSLAVYFFLDNSFFPPFSPS